MEIISFIRIDCYPLQRRTVARVTTSLPRLVKIKRARQREKLLYVLP